MFILDKSNWYDKKTHFLPQNNKECLFKWYDQEEVTSLQSSEETYSKPGRLYTFVN